MVFLSRNEATPTRHKPLPIQGMLRRKSGDSLVVPLLPVTNKRNLSRTTLHRVFAGMLLAVFIGYCILMLFLIRQHHQHNIFNSNTWGPTGHSMATAQQILKDHIKTLAKERRKELEKSHASSGTDKAKKVMEGPLGQGGVTAFEGFENIENQNIEVNTVSVAVQEASSQNLPKIGGNEASQQVR